MGDKRGRHDPPFPFPHCDLGIAEGHFFLSYAEARSLSLLLRRKKTPDFPVALPFPLVIDEDRRTLPPHFPRSKVRASAFSPSYAKTTRERRLPDGVVFAAILPSFIPPRRPLLRTS